MLCRGMKVFAGSSVLFALLCLLTSECWAQALRSCEDYFKRAMTRLDKGDHDGAISDFEKAIEALTCLAPQSGKGAGDCASGVRAIDPRAAGIWNNRAMVWFAKGDYEAAIRDLNRALALNPRLDMAWHNRGLVRRELGDLNAALTDYDRCLRLNPRKYEAWHSRGIVRFDQGDYSAALRDFDRAIELKKNFAEAWNGRGLALHSLGQEDEALTAFNRCLQFRPQLGAAFSNRGNAWRAKGQLALAIADLDKAVELDPQTAGNWNNRANLRFQLGDLAGAEADYNEAAKLRPTALIFNNRGLLKQAAQRFAEALEDFSRAIEFNPQFAAAYENRSKLLRQLGRESEATRDLAESERLQPF